MRKILIIAISAVAVLCLGVAVTAFALAQKPSTAAGSSSVRPSDAATPNASSDPSTAATPGTVFTTDATLADIPGWLAPALKISRAHSIHVWISTAQCMRKAGYTNFHYRTFWVPGAVARDSENFWTAKMSPADARKALTAEFGPTLISESSSGCHGEALVALQHQYLDGS